MVIDAWMQHGTVRFLRHEMLDSLWRWTGQEPPAEEVPVETTVAAMDAGGVDAGLISAWYGPEGALVSNDEVASFVEHAPDRLAGAAASGLRCTTPAQRSGRVERSGGGAPAGRFRAGRATRRGGRSCPATPRGSSASSDLQRKGTWRAASVQADAPSALTCGESGL